MTREMKEYNGVMLEGKRESETIQAPDLAAAKKEMTKRRGPEQEGQTRRWVCGLAPQSMTGHPVKP